MGSVSVGDVIFGACFILGMHYVLGMGSVSVQLGCNILIDR